MMENIIEQGDYFDLLKSIPDESVDLVLTDPPFGINYQNPYTHKKHNVLVGDEQNFSYTELAQESFRILKLNTAIFCFTGWSEYPQHFTELKQAGFTMKEPLICQKRAAGSASMGTFQTNSDWLLFAHKGKFKFQKTKLIRSKRAGTIPNKGRRPVPEFKTKLPSCWFGDEYPWASENSSYQKTRGLNHPTIKGLKFTEWLIQLASPHGGIVVDPFVGSGTTAEAAKNQGRNYIVGDIEVNCIEMTNKRLNQ